MPQSNPITNTPEENDDELIVFPVRIKRSVKRTLDSIARIERTKTAPLVREILDEAIEKRLESGYVEERMGEFVQMQVQTARELKEFIADFHSAKP